MASQNGNNNFGSGLPPNLHQQQYQQGPLTAPPSYLTSPPSFMQPGGMNTAPPAQFLPTGPIPQFNPILGSQSNNASNRSTPDGNNSLNSSFSAAQKPTLLPSALIKPPSLSSIMNNKAATPPVYSPLTNGLPNLPPPPQLLLNQHQHSLSTGSTPIAQFNPLMPPVPPPPSSLTQTPSLAANRSFTLPQAPPSLVGKPSNVDSMANQVAGLSIGQQSSQASSTNSSMAELNSSQSSASFNPLYGQQLSQPSQQVNFSNSLPASSTANLFTVPPSKLNTSIIQQGQQPASAPIMPSPLTNNAFYPPSSAQQQLPPLGSSQLNRSLDTSSANLFPSSTSNSNNSSAAPTGLNTPFPSSSSLFAHQEQLKHQQQLSSNVLAQTSQALSGQSDRKEIGQENGSSEENKPVSDEYKQPAAMNTANNVSNTTSQPVNSSTASLFTNNPTSSQQPANYYLGTVNSPPTSNTHIVNQSTPQQPLLGTGMSAPPLVQNSQFNQPYAMRQTPTGPPSSISISQQQQQFGVPPQTQPNNNFTGYQQYQSNQMPSQGPPLVPPLSSLPNNQYSNQYQQSAQQQLPSQTINRPPPTMADLISQNRQQQSQPQQQISQQQFYSPPAQQAQPSASNQLQQQQQQHGRAGDFSINNMRNRSMPQAVDLLKEKRLIVPYETEEEVPRPLFQHGFYTQVNCHHDLVRCTLTSIPESQSVLNKCRLPLGILIHPFKDLESLKVVQSSVIVRCRNCRSYINPFVHFLENSKWRCNLCYSINDVPDEFLYDPVTKTYGDPSKRPEINSSTIEFIAPSEYTLRPPPPAMYLYLLDVSRNAVNTGYLANFCETLAENLDKIPGDTRAQIGFITYSSSVHFYQLSDSLSQPRMMIYSDLDEMTLPMPDSLLVNLHDPKCRENLLNFLQSLPGMFKDTYETDSALGAALNAAYMLIKPTGGRISVFQTCLPNTGPGALKQRAETVDKDSASLAPQIDFYKQFALDCATSHVAVDLFMLNSLYADLATLSCVSKYSGGEIKYYPAYHSESNPEQVIRFCVDLKRYLTRKIGFEAVMRIRCTRGLAIHTFHGNFFVRSTDLLALPNVNPDSGFGMQINIEEALSDTPSVCFQAAILYTSSRSERRIRIHTFCLPVTKNINEIVNGADQEAIIGLVAKMAVDRATLSTLKEAKDALINVGVDYLQAYSQQLVSSNKGNSILSPYSLRLVPTLILALMKSTALRFGNVKLDDRVYAMNLFKTMPLRYLMLCLYPTLYPVHNLDESKKIVDASDTEICLPPRLNLSSEHIDRHGVYIMDCGEAIYMWVGRSVNDQFLQEVFDVKSFNELPDHSNDLPELDNPLSERIRNFLLYLYDSRPFGPTFLYFKEGSPKAKLFFQHMYEDKTESSVSYYEFLKYLIDQVNS